ncbi:MAG TPA: glucose-6-phosphate dehydrogenase assembly protein OpcA [Bryobacteraceae bacterium]|nr:glucose-6-phosphate dehydrogenase assembly protein OpcA [Bryobacteraceae bacterium]
MPLAVDPESILAELEQLWADLDSQSAAKGGVLRACSMTLAVVARDEEDASQARRTIGVIMHDQPCRALVVKMHDGAELAARVFAECWMPFGAQRQICSEGVEIAALPDQFAEVARVLTPLRAPDLPLVLWCRGPIAFSLRAFDHLFPLADKVILDSTALSSAPSALAFLRLLRSRGHLVADLAWTRLTACRQILAHLFQERRLTPSAIKSARVAYSGPAPCTGALYFASWIRLALPSVPIRLEAVEGDPGLRGVTLLVDPKSGQEGDLALTLSGSSQIEVRGCGRRRRSSLPPSDEAALMREELKILGRDPVFERVLE